MNEINLDKLLQEARDSIKKDFAKDQYTKLLYELHSYKCCWSVIAKMPKSVVSGIDTVKIEKYLDRRVYELTDEICSLKKTFNIGDDIDLGDV